MSPLIEILYDVCASMSPSAAQSIHIQIYSLWGGGIGRGVGEEWGKKEGAVSWDSGRNLCLPSPINSLNCREIIIKQSAVMRMLCPPPACPLSPYSPIPLPLAHVRIDYCEIFCPISCEITNLGVRGKCNSQIQWNYMLKSIRCQMPNLCTLSTAKYLLP